MFTGFPLFSRDGTPLGSPKHTVWTFCGAAAMVGVAELPVENTSVLTSCRGMMGVFVGSGIGLVAASVTLGATGKSSGCFSWRISVGILNASGLGSTSAGALITRIGAGFKLTGIEVTSGT